MWTKFSCFFRMCFVLNHFKHLSHWILKEFWCTCLICWSLYLFFENLFLQSSHWYFLSDEMLSFWFFSHLSMCALKLERCFISFEHRLHFGILNFDVNTSKNILQLKSKDWIFNYKIIIFHRLLLPLRRQYMRRIQ